jgi:hypothetical protein
MSTRDARGRFVSADVAAAERVLEAAVREAVGLLRFGLYDDNGTRRVESDHRHLAARVLRTAAHAVEPLLRAAS